MERGRGGGARAVPTICVCAGSSASLAKYQTVLHVYLHVAYSSDLPLSDSSGSGWDGSVDGSCGGCGFARLVDGPPNVTRSHTSCLPENGGWSDIPGGEVSPW